MELEYLSQLSAYLHQQQQQQQHQQQLPGTHISMANLTLNNSANVHQNGSLFVGELSFFCTEDDLSALFAPFAPILNIRIRRAENGLSLMHGSVVLANEEKARAAIFAFNGKEFMGRNIK